VRTCSNRTARALLISPGRRWASKTAGLAWKYQRLVAAPTLPDTARQQTVSFTVSLYHLLRFSDHWNSRVNRRMDSAPPNACVHLPGPKLARCLHTLRLLPSWALASLEDCTQLGTQLVYAVGQLVSWAVGDILRIFASLMELQKKPAPSSRGQAQERPEHVGDGQLVTFYISLPLSWNCRRSPRRPRAVGHRSGQNTLAMGFDFSYCFATFTCCPLTTTDHLDGSQMTNDRVASSPGSLRCKSSAHRFLHERADPCLFGGSQLL